VKRADLSAPAALATGAVLVAWLSGCGSETPTPASEPPPPPAEPIHIQIPGFPPLPVPADNPTTRQGVELGRRLFYDPILSGDSTQACASCHVQAHAFGDPRRLSLGIDGIAGTRHAPTIVNAGWNPANFWDGRASTLEDQAQQPVTNPIEMHETWERAAAKLQRHRDYPHLFRAAFGTPAISRERAAMAIAQFERTLVSSGSRYDRFLRGELQLAPSERRGYALFFTERGECFHCHVDKTFTDLAYHNNGLDSLVVDRGRMEVTSDPADRGKFKTPTLRNVELSAPYMHDGRFATLEEVVEHYARGGHGDGTVSPFILNLRRNFRAGRGLSAQDQADLVAFVKSLTDSSFVTNPAFASPFR
jgi:cytochrome c peroxidase